MTKRNAHTTEVTDGHRTRDYSSIMGPLRIGDRAESTPSVRQNTGRRARAQRTRYLRRIVRTGTPEGVAVLEASLTRP
jgi:hypothetical protein